MIQLESLANELILDVFEFFTTAHLIQAFIGLNSRFDKLLVHHIRTHQLDLHLLSKESFDILCNKFLPIIIDQVTTLRISADESPGSPELLLFLGFNINLFVRLESLSLYNIDNINTINRIIRQCQHLPHLVRLNIIKCDDGERLVNMIDLLNNIWSLATLEYCNLNGLHADETSLLYISTISLSIEYLSIENIPCSLNCLSNIFKCTPRLQRFCTRVYSYMIDDHIRNTIPLIKSMKLTFGGSVYSLNELLRSMTNLTCLTITILQIYFDGKAWEQLISTYLYQLKRFQLKMEIEFREINVSIEEVIDELLATFRTTFWLQERQWYVRCHWNPSDPYKWVTLYTLPYNFDTFDYSNKCCTKSTCPDEVQYWSFNRVKIFGHGTFENTLFDNFSLLRARFRNIRHLQVNVPLDDRFWSRFPELNHLTSLHVSIYKSSGYSELQTLFYHAPYLYSLKLQLFVGSFANLFELTSESIRCIDLIEVLLSRSTYLDREDCFILTSSSLGMQCEVLSIRIKHRKHVLYLIQKLSNLRLLIFECEDDKEFFRKFSSEKNELVRWLQSSLPSTYAITRHPRQQFLIRVWINRETNKTCQLDDAVSKLRHENRLSRFLTSFRQHFNHIITE